MIYVEQCWSMEELNEVRRLLPQKEDQIPVQAELDGVPTGEQCKMPVHALSAPRTIFAVNCGLVN